VPEHAWKASAADLAARWVAEARNGIDGTGVKPAFMKIGVDAGPLPEIGTKLVTAAAESHRATGLPIWSHTGDGVAALAQIDLLKREGTPLSAFVWVHAQNEKDSAVHLRAAREGVWVSFDGLSDDNVDRYVELVLTMRREGQLSRILVSHDAGWYHVGEPGGGTYRPHDVLFTRLLPALRQHGVSDRDIRRIVVENPRALLTPDVNP
jgi:phosphotriesterase-related protein